MNEANGKNSEPDFTQPQVTHCLPLASSLSDDDVNELCCEALGWTRSGLQGDGRSLFMRGELFAKVPPFCSDWNAVIVLWRYVDRMKNPPSLPSFFAEESTVFSSPRRHAIAFLVAMSKVRAE